MNSQPAVNTTPGVKQEKSYIKIITAVLISLMVFVAVFAGLSGKMEYEPRMTLAITAFAIMMWVLEPLPFSMTAIIVMVLLPVSGAVSIDLVLSGFSSPAIFLIIAGMMLAAGVDQTALGKRLAYYLLYKVGDKRGGVLGGLILIPQIMAVFIPAAAVRTTMLLPIAHSVLKILGIKRHDQSGRQLMMGVAVGTSISGTAILPAAIGNVITVDLIQYYLDETVTYIDWLLIALPIWVLLIPLTWWVLYRAYPSPEPDGKLKEEMQKILQELGPISSEEKRTILILFAVFVMWLLEGIHGWPPVIPALIGAILMALPRIGITGWEKLLQIKFGPLILLGLTLSMGRALYESGAISYLSKWLENDLTMYLFSNPLLAVLTVAVLTQLIHKVTSNVSTAVISSVPVVMALSSHAPDSPALLLAVVAGMTCLFGFVIVVETIPNVLVHGTGWISQRDFLKTGLWLTLITLALTALMAVTWWPWLGLM
ncbi:MAG: DASS family sodium-coupled anion symporter [Bacillaceae bacterium]|nr:DASS family sodium-coupled anion symporter [Bacillaceae bacterium]